MVNRIGKKWLIKRVAESKIPIKLALNAILLFKMSVKKIFSKWGWDIMEGVIAKPIFPVINGVTQNKSNFTGYDPKGGRNLQPDLGYIAPEVQLHHTMSPLADIFSFGMVICAIFNDGASLLACDGNAANYPKAIQTLPTKFQEIVDRMPKPLIGPVRKMISQDVRERPTSQLLAL
ncbi:hypothetical protein ACTXT7_016897, partial [Hymenolepis weldensis]